MNRRTFLRNTSATLAGTSLLSPLMAEDRPQFKMGIATTSYLGAWRPKDPYEFLERCHALGAAGIQTEIRADISPAEITKLRARAEQLGMYLEVMVPLPHGADTSAFEQSLKTARDLGAIALRSACLGRRRYETFFTRADWDDFVARSHKSLAAAVPLLDRYRIPLGLENHKDWTVDEMVVLLKKYSSPYLGSCLDFGNNVALLDEPMDVIEKLAPYTVTTHLKDMAVSSWDDGFLLSEVLLGDGYLDLVRAVSLVRQARPNTRFSLEMITRDPLQVPCLTEKYWASFPDRNGIYLARTLKFVEKHASSKPLPHVTQLPHEEQLRVEEQNVVACLRWAHENLAL